MDDRQSVVAARLDQLTAGFGGYVAAYDDLVPFSSEQLAAHRQCIALRERAGSVRSAVADPQFIASLRRTRIVWGIGGRASYLVAEASFVDAIVAAAPRLEELEPLTVDMPGLPSSTADLLWQVIETLGVVTNKAKLVAGTKTLHHLLPDLVVPMDRAWTGRFFQLHPPEWQDPAAQRRTFRRVYGQLAGLARRVQPGQYADGLGWRTTRTKIIDNALIGYCKTALGAEPGAAPRGNQVTIQVSGYPPAKNEAKSLLSAGHPYLDRALRLLAAAYQASAEQGFTPAANGAVALDVILRSPAGQAQSDATNYLGGIGDVLEDKAQRGNLDHLGDLATVWLYRNDRQIKQVSYRETDASQPGYTVIVRALNGQADHR
jgi:hypothetical protein